MKCYGRVSRIANEIRRNIAIILQFKIRDPRVLGMITVLGINISNDLSYAKVFITFSNGLDIISSDELNKKIKILRNASGFIRSLLAKTMCLRMVPQLFFICDDSIAESMRIYRLLTDVISSDSKEFKKKYRV